jgi:hypothetical protein
VVRGVVRVCVGCDEGSGEGCGEGCGEGMCGVSGEGMCGGYGGAISTVDITRQW